MHPHPPGCPCVLYPRFLVDNSENHFPILYVTVLVWRRLVQKRWVLEQKMYAKVKIYTAQDAAAPTMEAIESAIILPPLLHLADAPIIGAWSFQHGLRHDEEKRNRTRQSLAKFYWYSGQSLGQKRNYCSQCRHPTARSKRYIMIAAYHYKSTKQFKGSVSRLERQMSVDDCSQVLIVSVN